MTTCTGWSTDGRMGHPCDREAVEDGLCRQHANGARRRAEADLRFNDQQAATAASKQKLTAVCADLAAAFGWQCTPTYNGLAKPNQNPYTAMCISVPVADLVELLRHKEATR